MKNIYLILLALLFIMAILLTKDNGEESIANL